MVKKLLSAGLFLFAWTALGWAGDPVLFNPSPYRPVFNLDSPRGTFSRDLAPGLALTLDHGTLYSGTGLKRTRLEGLCYFAAWQGHRGLYQLSAAQILIYNASPVWLQAQVEGQSSLPGAGWLVRGNFALANAGPSVQLTDPTGKTFRFPVEGGKAYLILLSQGSPELVPVN